MKLARMKDCKSKFRVPYKLYEDEENVSQDFILVANDVYSAYFQHAIFEDGVFEYSQEQKEGIIANVNGTPFIFVTNGPFVVEQIPFETKVDINGGHIFISGIFAIDKTNMEHYDELKNNFEERIKEDLKEQIKKQIDDLNKSLSIIQ